MHNHDIDNGTGNSGNGTHQRFRLAVAPSVSLSVEFLNVALTADG